MEEIHLNVVTGTTRIQPERIVLRLLDLSECRYPEPIG